MKILENPSFESAETAEMPSWDPSILCHHGDVVDQQGGTKSARSLGSPSHRLSAGFFWAWSPWSSMDDLDGTPMTGLNPHVMN